MITLALIGLVLSIALPSFAAMVANNRLRTEVDALFHAIHVARKESVVRRRVVTICPSPDGQRCEPGHDWSAGWLMFVNLDRDNPPRIDEGEPLLHRHAVHQDTVIQSNRSSFSLRSTQLRATNGSLVFCAGNGRAEPRALIVSYTGRPRVARHDRRGNAYQCAD
jgi:type IV fimbrial biogenesis protein FimT